MFVGKKAFPFLRLMNIRSIRIMSQREAESVIQKVTGKPMYYTRTIQQLPNPVSRAAAAPNPPAAVFHTDGKWLANSSVSFDKFILTCTAARGSPSYIFKNMPLQRVSSISFQVLEVESGRGRICFGVTTINPANRCVSELPADPLQLKGNQRDWYTHTFSAVKGETITVMRSVKLFREQRSGDPYVEFMFKLQSLDAVYPFFCFSGGIKSIRLIPSEPSGPTGRRNPGHGADGGWGSLSRSQLNSPGAAARPPAPAPASTSTPASFDSDSGNECCICMDKKRVIICDPCGHAVYCAECKIKAESVAQKTCPICRAHVNKFIRFFA